MNDFNLMRFQEKVKEAMRSIEKILETERKPRLAEDVDHDYGAKFDLVNLMANTAIIAYLNCLNKIGLTSEVLKSQECGEEGSRSSITLRFDSSISCKFQGERVVDVPMDKSHVQEVEYEGSGEAGSGQVQRVSKVVHHVKEFHYQVEVGWSLSLYRGSQLQSRQNLQSRRSSTALVTQSSSPPLPQHKDYPPLELSLTWLLRQIHVSTLTAHFKVDTEDDKHTKTPRRNQAVQQGLQFATDLHQFCVAIRSFFVNTLVSDVLQKHHPAAPEPSAPITINNILSLDGQYPIFSPILPIMENASDAPTNHHHANNDATSQEAESPSVPPSPKQIKNHILLSNEDMTKLLNEQVRTLEEACAGAVQSLSPPSDTNNNILSSFEANVVLICQHLSQLTSDFAEAMSYIEAMLEKQLISAIGKRLTTSDLDNFVVFYNTKLLSSSNTTTSLSPKPFSYAIRRPEHYPVGLLSIESGEPFSEKKTIHSHSRMISASSASSPLKIPLTAATVMELTGEQYLHGWMHHKFGIDSKNHQIVARARQFSAFVLVIGTMTGRDKLEPKHAIIIQNKDEVLIPLLLEELPTSKEFKDAIQSLSPEQQRFARAYRGMQLASSVFGMCIIQIKPQLESLLGLPPDALDKEMKLTQDLMELFVEYQVPSDLLSYNGMTGNDVALEDKLSNVKDHVKSVLDVIESEKAKSLKEANEKTTMALENTMQNAFGQDQVACTFGSISNGPVAFGAPPPISECYGIMPAPQPFGSPLPPQTSSLFGAPSPAPGYAAPPLSMAKSTPQRRARALTSRNDAAQNPPPSTTENVASTTIAQPNDNNTPVPLQSIDSNNVDFTLIPQTLDKAIEANCREDAIRSTIIQTNTSSWKRNRQENLLSKSKSEDLYEDELQKEKNKAFDLLDALSRSGSLPIQYSELHVIVALTHCFERDVMETVIQDNINPIEKLERSTLLMASTVHGVEAVRKAIGDGSELRRLDQAHPLLLTSETIQET